MLQLQVLTDRQLESRTSLGDTNLTIGSSSFEGTLPAPPSTNLTNGAILDTEEELAEAGSYIRSCFWSMSCLTRCCRSLFRPDTRKLRLLHSVCSSYS